MDRCQITEYSEYQMVPVLMYLTIYCYCSYTWAVQLIIIPFGYLLYLLVQDNKEALFCFLRLHG